MAERRVCARCGTALKAYAGGRLCPSCLLRGGLPIDGGAASVTTPSAPGCALSLPHAFGDNELLAVTEKPGDKIGHYKLLQQIGEGGCGVVYMAEQQEPIRRKVAFKVIKVGMDTRQVIARFEAERQALALMDHPNIAKVLDAGATETGRPYFVMELVRGQRITGYCDENSLSTEERLGLFMQVCHAIQHAHQKGIIHRDIKPSNILVTVVDGKPVPKVIDFGIAKAVSQQLTDKTVFTAFEHFIGTPAYMSPEQAALSGVDVDTRSDIYSLGVLLYELLTGHTPFDPRTLVGAGVNEMRRVIREQEPPRPSTRLSTLDAAERTTVAKRRQAEPAELRRLVRGDLDWIVMKCLEKDRGRRYESANNVALDIAHHLQHEPVTAAAPSTVYRAQKFVRRHRTGLAMASALLLLLAAGVVVSTWQAVRATRAESKEKIQRAHAESERGRAERLRGVAEQSQATAEDLARQIARQLYASEMNMGLKAWRDGEVSASLAVLDRHQPRPGQEDLRGFEWYYLWRLCHSEQLTLSGHSNLVRAVAFSPDGCWLLSGGDDGKARLWDAATGREAAVLEGHTNGVSAVAFSPDGKTIATGGRDGALRLWDADAPPGQHRFGHADERGWSGCLQPGWPMAGRQQRPHGCRHRNPCYSVYRPGCLSIRSKGMGCGWAEGGGDALGASGWSPCPGFRARRRAPGDRLRGRPGGSLGVAGGHSAPGAGQVSGPNPGDRVLPRRRSPRVGGRRSAAPGDAAKDN